MENCAESGPVNAAPERIRVVLVDDHELAREGVRRLLGMDDGIEVVGEADTCWGAISAISRLQPGVVILDVRLRDGNSFEVSRAVKRLAPDARVLVLSAYDDRQYVASMVKTGVSGYLTKGSSGEDLVRAVHYAARGWLVFSPDISEKLAGLLERHGAEAGDEPGSNGAGGRPEAGCQGEEALTGREAEVMRHIFRGWRNRDIAEAMGISPKTVEVHIHRILLKLGARNRSQAIMNSLGLGCMGGLPEGGIAAGERAGKPR